MVTVGNVNNDGTMHAGTDGSNIKSKNFEVTLSAPGDRAVRGYDPQSGQALAQGGGTSMAAPQVAAAAALLKGILPDLDAKQIKQILKVTARKNEAGDPIVAVDEAVFEVINMKRKIDGLTALTRDELRNQGVIDAVATPVQGSPGDYFVRAIVQSLADIGGTNLTLDASPGHVIEGENPRHLAKAGELGWVVHLDDPNGTITVHRMDNLAGSRITLEMPDVNGTWTGTVTFTELTGNVEQAADDEGCDIALLRTLLNKPFPMTMEIKVDGNGTGKATVNIDLSSLNTGTTKARMDPITFSVQLSASALSFEDTLLQGATVSMGGSVAKKGDGLAMTGPFGLSMQGVGAKANYKVTKQ
jgi:hypothetical protein